MAKNNGGRGKSKTPTKKNPGMIGAGKKTPLTRKQNGSPDWGKFAKDVKKSPSPKPKSKSLTPQVKASSTPTKKQSTAKGISKLKTTATIKKTPAPQKQEVKTQTPKSPSIKGISKLKASTPTSKPKTVKAPVKKGPSKGR